jgi:hypothetical protein
MRIRKHRCEQCGFRSVQFRCRLAEVVLSCGFYSVNAIAEFDDVQIGLQYSPFVPAAFQQQGEVRFESLSHPRASRPKKQVLGRLLGQRTGSFGAAAPFIVVHRLLNRLPVKAAVLGKVLIFRGNDSSAHDGCDFVERTQWYAGEYFPSLNQEAMRRSIIKVVTGGCTRRKRRTGRIVAARKSRVILKTQERSRWKKGLTAMLGSERKSDTPQRQTLCV